MLDLRISKQLGADALRLRGRVLQLLKVHNHFYTPLNRSATLRSEVFFFLVNLRGIRGC